MKTLTLAITLLAGTMSAQDLPDAPQPQFQDTSPRAMKLTENRPRVFDKKFTALTVVFFASGIADAEISARGVNRGLCTEAYGPPHSNRAQLYGRILGIDTVIFGLSYFLKRGNVMFAPYVPMSMGTAIHVHLASQWYTKGCMG